MIQEAFGVNDHIRDVADRFGSEGYYVVAPELFHRSGSPQIPYDDFPLAMEHLGQLTREGIEQDLRNASAYLTTHGYHPANTAIVGYCMGGTVSIYGATLAIAAAAATYYGSGIVTGRFGLPPLLDLAPIVTSSVIGFFGDLDAGIPIDQVEHFRDALATSSQPSALYRYEQGHHGFHCDGRPDQFNADYARDAYRHTLAFFAQHVVSR